MNMLIERVSPELVGAKSTLPDCLRADPRKHPEYLAEMFPTLRVKPAIPAEHEVGGLGEGNRTVDWVIGPVDGRRVLVDVKRRLADFIAAMGELSADDAPAPRHDVGLLFRSVESKYLQSDPDELLQGAWIVTDIKQSEKGLQRSALRRWRSSTAIRWPESSAPMRPPERAACG
jgi:hypothetical protein